MRCGEVILGRELRADAVAALDELGVLEATAVEPSSRDLERFELSANPAVLLHVEQLADLCPQRRRRRRRLGLDPCRNLRWPAPAVDELGRELREPEHDLQVPLSDHRFASCLNGPS